MKGFGQVLWGVKWIKVDYVGLLMMMYELLCWVCCGGIFVIEQDIELLELFDLFVIQFCLQVDLYVVGFICDSFCLIVLDLVMCMQIVNYFQDCVGEIVEECQWVVGVLQILVDVLFVLGIVVVVFGIIKIMVMIDQLIVVFGEMIVFVLFGIFLGVFFVYGFVGLIVNCFG